MANGSLTVQPHLYIGDSTGRPLDYGQIYFGEPNKDPEYHPINIYYDPELTDSASQPVRTKGGFMNAFGDMVEVYAIEQSYSVKVLDANGVTVFYKAELNRTLDINTTIRANNFLIAPSVGDKVGQQVFEYRDAVDLIWTIVPAGIYLKDNMFSKGMVWDSPRIASPRLTSTFSDETLDAPNLVLAADGSLKTSNDPLNASTRKVGIVEGNLVERGADGYPTNNNAIGVGQTWQDMTASRVFSTTYTNTSGRPITISIAVGNNSPGGCAIDVDGVEVARYTETATNGPQNQMITVVPNNATYVLRAYSGAARVITLWAELK